MSSKENDEDYQKLNFNEDHSWLNDEIKPLTTDQITALTGCKLNDPVVSEIDFSYTTLTPGTITQNQWSIGAIGSQGSVTGIGVATGTNFSNWNFNNLTGGAVDYTIPGKAYVGEDVIIDGTSLKSMIENINDRLSILTPRPELLEKYAALREAYEHYKTLESLVINAKDDTEDQ